MTGHQELRRRPERRRMQPERPCMRRMRRSVMKTMKAVVFKGKDRLALEEVAKPSPKAGQAVIRITTTTICGTDVHIVRGEYPVEPGRILGHEPVGVID